MPAPTAPYQKQEEDQSERKKEKERGRQTRQKSTGDRQMDRRAHWEGELHLSEEVHTAITNEEEPQFNSNRITLISDRSDWAATDRQHCKSQQDRSPQWSSLLELFQRQCFGSICEAGRVECTYGLLWANTYHHGLNCSSQSQQQREWSRRTHPASDALTL